MHDQGASDDSFIRYMHACKEQWMIWLLTFDLPLSFTIDYYTVHVHVPILYLFTVSVV